MARIMAAILEVLVMTLVISGIALVALIALLNFDDWRNKRGRNR